MQKRRCRCHRTILKLVLGSGSGVASLGFLVEDVLHGSPLLVAQLEALLSARVKSRRSIGATEIAADGKADSVDVLLLAGGSSTVSQSLLKLVGETTRGMVLHVVGLLLDVGV